MASTSAASAAVEGPVKRIKANNVEALEKVRKAIELKSLPWIETLVVSYDRSIEEEVSGEGDGAISAAAAANDDLRRELAFYKQALNAAVQGQALARQSSLPFSRPSDFFAEMVKTDEHMERVRQTLLDQKAGLKASEDARKQRELKKYGKKVQVERQQERQRNKREFDEKVKDLKRKRKGGLNANNEGGDGDQDDDQFDVRLENAITDEKRQAAGGPRSAGKGANGKPTMRRDARNSKYGFGGKKKHAKENTRESTNDFGAGSKSGARRQGGGAGRRAPAKRPGKARRAAAGARR